MPLQLEEATLTSADGSGDTMEFSGAIDFVETSADRYVDGFEVICMNIPGHSIQL